LKLKFSKISENGTYCKLHFLLPNDLIDLNRETEKIYKIAQKVDEEYILYTKLLLYNVEDIKSLTEGIVVKTESILKDLKTHNNKQQAYNLQ
jgi:hypothetical protein